MEKSSDFFSIFRGNSSFCTSKKLDNPRIPWVYQHFFDHLPFDKNAEWTILNLGEEL